MTAPTIVFDLETKKLAEEVGGWSHIADMGLACAVTLNTATGEFGRFLEADASILVAALQDAALVVGFNLKRFDYTVLQPYTTERLADLPTLDLLEHVERALGFRLPLDELARATLGVQKAADGVLAVQWFRQGRVEDVLDYCQQDVTVTRDLYEHGRLHKHLKYRDRRGRLRQVNVTW